MMAGIRPPIFSKSILIKSHLPCRVKKRLENRLLLAPGRHGVNPFGSPEDRPGTRGFEESGHSDMIREVQGEIPDD
jgi:hypothetical protein